MIKFGRMKSFRRFFHTSSDIFRIYWEIAPGLTVGVLFTQILLSFQGIVTAFVFGFFLDKVIGILAGSRDIYGVLPVVGLYLLVEFMMTEIEVLSSYFSGLLSNIDAPKLRLKQTDLMVRLGISQMEDAELTNKSTRFSEVYSSINQHLGLLVGLIALVISTVAYGVIVFTFAPIIILISLFFFIIKYFNNGRFINKVWRLSRDYTEERRNAWDSVMYLAQPSSLKEVVLSGGVDFLRNKFLAYINWYVGVFKRVRTRWAIWEGVHSVSDLLSLGAGIIFLIQKFIENVFSLGTFTFYIRSLGSFTGQLDTLSYRIARTVESSIRLQDALELFELYKPEEDGRKELLVENAPPVIEMKNVTFKYPNGKEAVLKGMNLSFGSGERVAIVGENGAGKTTLVKLLTRIYRPQQGVVTLNNIDINDLKKESLYKKFGVLFQDFNSYGNLTVSENVQVGKPTRKMDKNLIEQALIKADAMNFVGSYPRFLDQILSERYKGGIRPSGGQWQKIALARLFYRNAPILILDEPTASIDAVSEAKIFDNVYKFMKGKTVIIISHRFSTVRNADRILVLDKGRIVEEGNHDSLMKQKGKYYRAFSLQAKGYK